MLDVLPFKSELNIAQIVKIGEMKIMKVPLYGACDLTKIHALINSP